MNYIDKIEKILKESIKGCGYETDEYVLNISNRKDLGQFQYNGAMAIAKSYHKNPRIVAEEIKEKLDKNDMLDNINIAGPGFVNISIKDKYLVEYINELNKDIQSNMPKYVNKKIMIDYGGANVAKALHVGHLRSANIGESLKRLLRVVGNTVISDVHLGDIGRQAGMVIYELKQRQPGLVYFDDNFNGEYPKESPVTNEDLEQIYPVASNKAKEDELVMETVRQITAALDNGHKGYTALWKHISEVSIKNIKTTYDRLNTQFDLFEGESHSYEYIDETLDILKKKNILTQSQGAYVIDVSDKDDKKEIPPLIVLKTDGTTVYATRELATLLSRVKRFNPDEILYVVDNRQELYFKQVFRAAYKSGIVPETTKLQFIGFGTMNGKDGKPFKTRDGGIMKLDDLLNDTINEVMGKIKENISNNEQRNKIAQTVGIAAVKYADLVPCITTDYIFDPEKFTSLEGKTGPYILYSTVRMKSLINKAVDEVKIDIDNLEYKGIYSQTDKDVIITLLNAPKYIETACKSKTLNEITEYIYELSSIYNKFYSENKILIQEDNNKRESWCVLSKVVFKMNKLLLDILAIDIPEKM